MSVPFRLCRRREDRARSLGAPTPERSPHPGTPQPCVWVTPGLGKASGWFGKRGADHRDLTRLLSRDLRSVHPSRDAASGEAAMAFYELRQYQVRPGKMPEWLKVMEEEIIPFQVAKGMVITGSFRGETGRIPSTSGSAGWRARRSASCSTKRVYRSDHWKERDRAAHPRPPRPREDGRHPHRPDHPLDRAISGKVQVQDPLPHRERVL